MPDSRREDVLAAVKTALEVASVTKGALVVTKPTGLTVRRHPERSANPEDLPIADVFQLRETIANEITLGVTKTLELGVRALVRWNIDANTYGSGDEALDELMAWIEGALLDDETLGGAANLVNYTGFERPNVAERAEKFAEAVLTFSVTYQTGFGNPWAAP